MKRTLMTRQLNLPTLRLGLVALFISLTLPIAALVWHAYGQLKWEAYYQYRGMAEELSDRINSNFERAIQRIDSRRFADYSFLVVAGDTSAPFLQRSPLSAMPVADDIPGAIGYFQIDATGQFSTPLLPGDDTSPQAVGISSTDFNRRQLLATELLTVLHDNQLVEESSGNKDELLDASVQEEIQSEQSYPASAPAEMRQFEQQVSKIDSQRAFDKLKSLESSSQMRASDSELSVDANTASKDSSIDIITTVPQLKLDLHLEERSRAKEKAEQVASQVASQAASQVAREDAAAEAPAPNTLEAESGSSFSYQSADNEETDAFRSSRKERNYVPEITSTSLPTNTAGSLSIATDADTATIENPVSDDRAPDEITAAPILEQLAARRITTFESDIDPMEISLLGSGHFVAYRTVWREGKRLIQGALIDRTLFINQLIGTPFQQARVSSMSSLSLLYENNLLDTTRQNTRNIYASTDAELQGALLYRNRMPAPLGALELVFSIKKLPPGPGASVLAWVTAALAIVLSGGFYLLYRAGREQIALAAQQQDFVSAVSHELKTPLTSIRMYSELLKEGWASEEKKEQYYAFIHDESERLSRLIDNVLKLARINRNEISLDLQETTVSELMSSIQANLQQQAGHSGFDVQFRVCESAANAVVVVDKDSIMQIMVNLLDNAIKFSKHANQKVIEISVHGQSDDKVVLSVRDFGPGIPKDQLTNIFRMFYRSESELTRETVGTGIGLAIVNQLCVAMNAEIDVINREPGAEFLVRLERLVGHVPDNQVTSHHKE